MAEVIGRLQGSFRSRPLVWITLAFAGGIGLNGWLSAHRSAGLGYGLWAAAVVSFALCWRRRSRALVPPVLLVCVLALALGGWRGRAGAPEFPWPAGLAPFFDSKEAVFTGRLQAPLDFYPTKTRFELALHQVEVAGRKIPVAGGVQISVGSLWRDWPVGSWLSAPLSLKGFHNYGVPRAFDYQWFQAVRGLHARAYVKSDLELRPLDAPPAGAGRRWTDAVAAAIDRQRQGLRRLLHRELERPAAVLAEALFLGYRHEIEPEFQDALNRVGVTHLLAISGLHLGLVAMVLFRFGRLATGLLWPRLLIRASDRHAAWLLALAGALGYALISGLALPTWRAALMLTALALVTVGYRRPDPLSFLALAALLMLAVEPNLLWLVSFQLSFGSLLGILLVYPRFQPLLGRLRPLFARPSLVVLRPVVESFGLSLAVSVVLLPVIAYHFHGVSAAGFFANAVLVPLVGLLVLPLGLFGLALSYVAPAVAGWILQADGRLLDLVRALVMAIGEWSWSYLWIGLVPVSGLSGCYLAAAALLLPGRRRSRVVFAVLSTVLFCLAMFRPFGARSAPGRLEATVIDVGQGSSTLLVLPQGQTILVDGGGTLDHAFDTGRQVVAPFLWSQGIRRLDLVVLSHDHPDHGNGLRFILSQFTVGEYWESGYSRRPGGISATAEIAAKRGIPVRTLNALPDTIEIDGCTLQVLSPVRPKAIEPLADLNKVSLVLVVRFGATQIILPGDIDHSVEERLAVGGALRGGPGLETLLVTAHHGSRRSTGELWLDRLRPGAALISCGFDNGFGFPAEATLERLSARRIPIHRTDQAGTLYAVSDGRTWRLRGYRMGELGYRAQPHDTGESLLHAVPAFPRPMRVN